MASKTSQEIYGLTGGRVALGGITTGSNGWRGISTQVYNWGTDGAKDAENNGFYDTARRFERTAAVLSCVGATYEEKRQERIFTRIDWKEPAYADHLQKLGFGNTSQVRLQEAMDHATWVYQDRSGITRQIDALQLTKSQKQQFFATGKFEHQGNIITAGKNPQELRRMVKAAMEEERKNSRMFDVSEGVMARHSLQQLRDAQVELCANIASQYGGKTFNGTPLEVRHLEKRLLQEREKLVSRGMGTDIIDAQIKDVKIAKETGLSAGPKDKGAMAAQRRSYGRQIVLQKLTGDDFNQGIAFYRNAGRLTESAVRVAYRGAVGITAGAVALPSKVVGKVAGQTAAGRSAKAVVAKTEQFKDGGYEFARKKTKAEKKDAAARKKDRRIERGNERFERKVARNDETIARLENAKTSRADKKGSLSPREQKRLDRANAKRDRYVKRGKSRIAGQEKKLKRQKLKRKIYSAKAGVQNFFSKLSPLRLLDFLKRKIILVAGTSLASFIFMLISCGGTAFLIVYMINFLSESGAQGLDSLNYVQLIVNETAGDLSMQFQEVAKNDAETHFLIDDPIPSGGGIEWYKNVSEGEIRHIWAADEMNLPEAQRKELSGVSANLLQLTSLMHFRYNDEIGYEEYYTAKAYEYYMFVRTHRVAEDADGNPTYSYEELDDHDNAALYATAPVYHPGTQELVRGEETCENVYVHGYNTIHMGDDASFGLFVNRARATMEGFLSSCITDIANANGITVDTSFISARQGQGLWINEVPHDGTSVCTNYTAYPAGYGDGFFNPESGCPGYEHTHGAECYKEIVGSQNPDGTPNMVVVEDCPYGGEHHHIPWTSEQSPGCYDTAYVCNGHCGGHVCPTVDIEIDMAWEDIMKYDNFSTPYFLASTSFRSLLNWGNSRTLEAWAEKWMDRASEWFSPFPSSRLEALEWFGRKLRYKSAEAIDHIMGNADNPEQEDIYDFEGWMDENGNIDESILDDIETFYGTYDTDFEDGVEAWKDFEVTFPAGSVQPLTDEQIASVLAQVKAGYPEISARKLAVLEEALRGVGKYWYSLSGAAHNNAINNTSGAGECSGFVAGVLNRALGTNYGSENAAAYYHYGTPAFPTSGDVIAHLSGPGSQASGHVLFYVGYLPEGLPGYTITNKNGQAAEQSGGAMYVIDCTPTYGGSVFRKYSDFSGMHSWGGY